VRNESKLWVLPVVIPVRVVRAQPLDGIPPAHESGATSVELITQEKPHWLCLNNQRITSFRILIGKIRITWDGYI
jgi:hypothetical protein